MSVNIYDSTNDELNQIAGREDTSYWEGTQAQWNALSSADKALWTGKYVIITDDAEDASTLTVTFTSNDVANTDTTKTDSGWTDTSILTSGEHLSTIFTKVSNMFKNIRRLWNTVGTTTIPSGLGSTVTGAIENLTVIDELYHPSSPAGVGTVIKLSHPFTDYRLINIVAVDSSNASSIAFTFSRTWTSAYLDSIKNNSDSSDGSNIICTTEYTNNGSLWVKTASQLKVRSEPMRIVAIYGIR